MSSSVAAPASGQRPAPIKRMPSRIRPGITYFDHQVEGIRWLSRRTSWLLCDEQGLGKTLQGLSVAALDFDEGWASRVLVIANASVKWNIADEIEKLTTFTYEVLTGTPEKRMAQLDAFDSEILLVNFEQVMSHGAQLTGMGFDIVIVDECQEIKNWDAKRTRAVHRLTPGRWFLMSGTPLETRPTELWSPLRLIDPANTPSSDAWANRYCVFEAGTGRIKGIKRKAQLKRHIEQVFLRRLKADCLDLPPKQYIKINVELSALQRRLHDQAERELQLELPNNPDPLELESGLLKAMRLKQICSNACNIEGYPDDSAKLDVAMEQIRELTANGHKVVCFSGYRPTLAALEARCEAENIPHWAIHGGVKDSRRKPLIDEWKAHEGPAVISGNYPVLGVSYTLTEARHMIIIDKLYGPGAMTQAEDRIHRIGASSADRVQIIELIARNTYEQRIESIINEKGEMIDDLIPNSGWKPKLYEMILEGGSA